MEIQHGDGSTTPSLYALAPEQGSAYYLIGDEQALIQVPLLADGTPDFEGEQDGFFGGGEVDWTNGFEDAEQAKPVREIHDQLKAAHVAA